MVSPAHCSSSPLTSQSARQNSFVVACPSVSRTDVGAYARQHPSSRNFFQDHGEKGADISIIKATYSLSVLHCKPNSSTRHIEVEEYLRFGNRKICALRNRIYLEQVSYFRLTLMTFPSLMLNSAIRRSDSICLKLPQVWILVLFWSTMQLLSISSVRTANAFLHRGGNNVALGRLRQQSRSAFGYSTTTNFSQRWIHQDNHHGIISQSSGNQNNPNRSLGALQLYRGDSVAYGGSERRLSSTRTKAGPCKMTIADTPLGTTKEGSLLLDGLDVYSVPAKGDDHPLTVYGIDSEKPSSDDIIVLMLHGRTWSSVPVYHLLGGSHNASGKPEESRSLMEAMRYSKKNIQPYCMDFRGFGGTPRDERGIVEPNRCVEDVETVLEWIVQRHGLDSGDDNNDNMPVLLGWSQGALVAQLVAQKNIPHMSKLILYGSIYDPMIRYPREPLYTKSATSTTGPPADVENDYDGAIEDFTIEGTIPPEPARLFAEAALLSDPIKAQWRHLHQFNNCDPARIHVPTLVVRFNVFKRRRVRLRALLIPLSPLLFYCARR